MIIAPSRFCAWFGFQRGFQISTPQDYEKGRARDRLCMNCEKPGISCDTAEPDMLPSKCSGFFDTRPGFRNAVNCSGGLRPPECASIFDGQRPPLQVLEIRFLSYSALVGPRSTTSLSRYAKSLSVVVAQTQALHRSATTRKRFNGATLSRQHPPHLAMGHPHGLQTDRRRRRRSACRNLERFGR